jgi:ACR3 family arsenite transporter
MLAGTLIGVYAPAVTEALAKASVGGINIVVTILLWVMITPMFMGIDWASLAAVRHAPGAILLTSTLNFAIKPFTMYALALLFFRVFYAALVPPADADSYIAGLILLAGAPCTAMVFVWSALLGGDAAYTLVQVATNDLIMLALYVPTACLLIGASNIALPWVTIIISVVLFIVVPLAAAAAARFAALRVRDEAWLKSRVIDRAKPACIAALLGTLVLIFVFQGAKIAAHPLDILLLAVPIVCQCALLWAMCYAAGWATCVPHARLAPASLIATSNFFELAVAVAISVYGLDSGAALATVVGVLVEVPAMLCLVYVCRWWKPALDARCAACATVCPAAERISSAATDAVCCTASGGARRRGALLSARDVADAGAAAATSAIRKATADAKAARTGDAGRSSG